MIDKTSLFPLLLSTIAGLSTVLGAIIIFFSKTRNEKFLTFSLGFSAGVMIDYGKNSSMKRICYYKFSTFNYMNKIQWVYIP